MKNLYLLILLGLFSCNNDIRKVKEADSIMATEVLSLGSEVKTNEDFVNAIAGIQGQVTWKVFTPKGYEKSKVVCIQADINKHTSQNNLIVFQFLLNKETGLVKFYDPLTRLTP